MDLSPEERQKIYEEEKARTEARQKIKKEQQQKAGKKAGMGCLVIIGIIVFGAVLASLFPGDKNQEKELKLNGIAKFTGTQFVISNTDAYDWENVSLYIDEIVGGYKLTYPKIEVGETYSVGAAQFAKDNGTRYNPFTQKPKKLYIVADTPEGEGNCVFGWDD
jgi:hypothetical protein